LFKFQFSDDHYLLVFLAAAGTFLRKVSSYSVFSIIKLQVYTYIML